MIRFVRSINIFRTSYKTQGGWNALPLTIPLGYKSNGHLMIKRVCSTTKRQDILGNPIMREESLSDRLKDIEGSERNALGLLEERKSMGKSNNFFLVGKEDIMPNSA